ncbi:MAG: MgtC/SapB family protein [Paracoccaceae bacterium]
MTIALDAAAINMFAALACGALIGSERQVRQRMAGLRTNALVALGAAAFVIFSQLFPDEVSPTRVAAQVVSGIGFLGAGIIFRDGFNVHGLNTAATLWCSAAVGLMAGAGALAFAGMLTGMVVFVNLGLRPLVKWLKRHTRAGVPVLRQFRITLVCPPEMEGEVRALLLRTLAGSGANLASVTAAPEGAALVLTAQFGAEAISDQGIDAILQRLAAEPGLLRAECHPADEV